MDSVVEEERAPSVPAGNAEAGVRFWIAVDDETIEIPGTLTRDDVPWLARRCFLKRSTLASRLDRGWDLRGALLTPPRAYAQRRRAAAEHGTA